MEIPSLTHAAAQGHNPATQDLSWRTIATQAALGIAILLAFALMQGVDFDWDVFNYHFYNGFAVLHGKTFVNVQPSMLQSYFCPLLDVPFYLLVRHVSATLVLVSLALFQSLSYPLLFAIASAQLRPFMAGRRSLAIAATLLALTGIFAPVNILEAGGAYGDNTSDVFVLGAVFALTIKDRRPRLDYASGALAGIAAGLKLTNAPAALGVLVASSIDAIARRKPCVLIASAAGLIIAFGLAYGWWGALLWKHFANPFFPSFNNVFQSPYAAASAYKDPAFALPAFWDKLIFPFEKAPILGSTTPAGLFDARLAISIPIAAAALLLDFTLSSQQSFRSGRVLLVFFLVSYVGWLIVFPINRYAVALDSLAPIVSVVGLCRINPGRRALICAISLALLLVGASQVSAVSLWWRPFARHVPDGRGYFGSAAPNFPADINLANSTVAIMGDRPAAYAIPYAPLSTRFVRLHGSLFYPMPGYGALGTNHRIPPTKLREMAFGNAMGRQICTAVQKSMGPLWTLLSSRSGPSLADSQAEKFFGLQTDLARCRAAARDGSLVICPARRAASECDSQP